MSNENFQKYPKKLKQKVDKINRMVYNNTRKAEGNLQQPDGGELLKKGR